VGLAMALPLPKNDSIDEQTHQSNNFLDSCEFKFKVETGFQRYPLTLWHFVRVFFLFFPSGFFSFFASQQKKKRNETKIISLINKRT